jgi:hypothetical protein
VTQANLSHNDTAKELYELKKSLYQISRLLDDQIKAGREMKGDSAYYATLALTNIARIMEHEFKITIIT